MAQQAKDEMAEFFNEYHEHEWAKVGDHLIVRWFHEDADETSSVYA